ncbi:hypothetical protein WJX81_006090 [Elliptochloris bilobata]|uniref:oligopeptidase A n=1 Tax=Elliptochloris bilobata TaxID=381761 RepID=A0AAW1SAD9_9CHLO
MFHTVCGAATVGGSTKLGRSWLQQRGGGMARRVLSTLLAMTALVLSAHAQPDAEPPRAQPGVLPADSVLAAANSARYAAFAARAPIAAPAQGGSAQAPNAGSIAQPRGEVAAARKSGGNPLLAVTDFPLYDVIAPVHVEAGMNQVLAELEAAMDRLEARVAPTWQGLVDPLTRIQDRYDHTWGVVQHLLGVKNSEALRVAAAAVQPRATAFGQRLGQSAPVYQAFQALRDGPLWGGLSRARRAIVEQQLLGFKLGGVTLEGGPRKRFNAIQAALDTLGTNFSNNLQDATAAFQLHLSRQADVAGLPPSSLALLAQQARNKANEGNATAEAGPWLVTLDGPIYGPVMQYAENRNLREMVYKAFITRASSGSTNNQPVIEQILALRREQAAILNYTSYTDYALADRMATPTTATDLLEQLRAASYPAAKQDVEDVAALAKSRGQADALAYWDLSFWAQRLQQARFNLTDEQLRPYFALPTVLDGLHSLVHRIFNATFEAADGEVPVWDPAVRFYRVYKDGNLAAYLYFDPYARSGEKRVGSWMNGAVAASALLAPPGQALRLPVAYIVTALPAPVGNTPALLSMGDVRTVFHEHGHALQHMLTEQTDYFVSGINGIPRDAVEEPSQFMEFWPYDESTLAGIARHYQTGAPLPADLYAKLMASRTFRAGTQSLQQLHYAITDLALHTAYVPQPGTSVFASQVYREATANTTVIAPIVGDRWLCSFSHIFSDSSYAAGYYSYKWAEILSADGFSAFEEAGLSDGPAVVRAGMRYRATVLALGGGVPPAEVFADFRGRNATTVPLLVSEGLLPAAAAARLAEADAKLRLESPAAIRADVSQR